MEEEDKLGLHIQYRIWFDFSRLVDHFGPKYLNKNLMDNHEMCVFPRGWIQMTLCHHEFDILTQMHKQLLDR